MDLLYKAGEIARSNDEQRIVESDVHAAREKLEQSQIEQGIRELTRHGHFALVPTLHLALEGDTPARVRDIYPQYRAIATRSEADPLVRRRIHDHLADLAMLGILDRYGRNEGRSGGQYYEYEFSADLDRGLEAVGEFETRALPRTVARSVRARG